MALNNQQWLLYNKTKPNQTKPINLIHSWNPSGRYFARATLIPIEVSLFVNHLCQLDIAIRSLESLTSC